MYVTSSVIDGFTPINTYHPMVAHTQPIFNRIFYRGTSIATLAYSVPLNIDCNLFSSDSLVVISDIPRFKHGVGDLVGSLRSKICGVIHRHIKVSPYCTSNLRRKIIAQGHALATPAVYQLPAY